MRTLFALALLGAAGCGERTPPELGPTKAEVEKLVRTFHDAMNAGDLEAISGMCAADFSLAWSGADPAFGRENALKEIQKFVDYHKAHDLLGKRKPRFDEIRIRQEGTIAWAVYTVAFIEQKPQSIEVYTQMFRREGGRWMLIHDQRGQRQ